MNIAKSSRLALYALVLMAERPGELITATLVASTFEVSESHVAKLLQQLGRAGLLLSVRGAHGGYKLAVDADELSMLDVIEIIEGPVMPTCYGCAGANAQRKCTLAANCVIKVVLERIGQHAYDTLKVVTIGALARRKPEVGGEDLLALRPGLVRHSRGSVVPERGNRR
jgi:Rrf2 family protein